jgi:Protein of unknown function (DUF3039)
MTVTVRPADAQLGQSRSTCDTGQVSTPTTPESATLVEERTDLRPDEGDHERFAHYADRDKIMEAMVNGTPVRALCGKVWVPSRDPQRFPICPECKEIYESLPLPRD